MHLRMTAYDFVVVSVICKGRLKYVLVFTVGAMPEVAALNRSDLEDLLACDDKLTEFVASLPQVAAARNQCDQLAAQNEAAASKEIIVTITVSQFITNEDSSYTFCCL